MADKLGPSLTDIDVWDSQFSVLLYCFIIVLLTIMRVFVAYDLGFFSYLLNEIIFTVPLFMLASLIPCFVPPLKLIILFHFQLSVKSPQSSTDVAEQGDVVSQEILSNMILFCFF